MDTLFCEHGMEDRKSQREGIPASGFIDCQTIVLDNILTNIGKTPADGIAFELIGSNQKETTMKRSKTLQPGDSLFGVMRDGSLDRRVFLSTAARVGAGLMGAAAGSAFAQTPAQGQPLTLGWIRPSTGRLASFYAPQWVGGLIACDEINAMGGIMGRPLVRVEEDDEASPAKEPVVAKKLLDAKPFAFVGPSGSSQALASVAFSTQAKVFQTANAGAAEIGDATKYPYFYQTMMDTGRQTEVMVRHLIDKMKVKRIGIMQENTAFGEQGTKTTLAMLATMGIKDVPVEVYPLTAPDLAPYVRNLRSANVDGVIAWIATAQAAAGAFNTMNRLQWSPPVVGHTGIFTESIFDFVPVEAVKNVYATFYRTLTWAGSEMPSERHIAYAKKIATYPEAKGNEPFVAAAPYYDFIYLLKHGVETAKSFDPEKVKAVLDNTKGFKGMLGNMSFTATNHSGLGADDVVLASIASAKDPKSMSIFRERLSDKS